MDKDEKLSIFAEIMKQKPKENSVNAVPVNTVKTPEAISGIRMDGNPCPAFEICNSIGNVYEFCKTGSMPTAGLSLCIANLLISQDRFIRSFGGNRGSQGAEK